MVTKKVEPSKGFVSLLWWQNFWISTKSDHATDANMAEEKRKKLTRMTVPVHDDF